MSDKGCVTIECSVIIVRAHAEEAKFGDYAPFQEAFTLVQVKPGIFEAKGAKGVVLSHNQQRSLAAQLIAVGGTEVFYTRHKPGRPPMEHRINLAKIAKKDGD